LVLAVLSGGLYRTLTAQEPQQQNYQQDLARARAGEVFMRNYEQLKKHPDILGLSHRDGKIRIVTDRPHAVPKEVEDVPVEVVEPPPHLPAPPGVIVLFDEGTEEHRPHQQQCKWSQHIEERHYRWRFCRSENRSSIPTDLTHLPIGRVPARKALEIRIRNGEWLSKLPGVAHVGLNDKGIVVGTSRPELIPSHVEGPPVIIEPPDHSEVGVQDHSLLAPVQPLSGAIAAVHDLSDNTRDIVGNFSG
jgi:hypothetical protein